MNQSKENILNHYEKFLGNYLDADKYTNRNYNIQLLGFDNTFTDSITFATLGLSNYSNVINNTCEIIMAVDNDYDDCATIMMNALFYILQEKIAFGRGTLIEGVDNIVKDFSSKHNKTALFFTLPYILPDDFFMLNTNCKIYMAFLVTDSEVEYIKKYGCEKFEELLEAKEADVIDINRLSTC